MQIKVLTLNTWKAEANYRARMELLLKELICLRPDLVMLQEVFRSLDGSWHTLGRLAAGLGMAAAFLPMRRKLREVEGRWLDSFSGMGVLSAFPISYMEAVELPSTPADGGRAGQVVKISAGNAQILLGNVHLSFLADQDDLKIRQLDCLLRRMTAHESADAIFLGGDFNSLPESPVVDFLNRHSHFQARDTYAQAETAVMPGWTHLEQPGSGKRIDYLFSLSTPQRPHPRLLHSEVVLKDPTPDGLLPSDHFGVFSQFQLDN